MKLEGKKKERNNQDAVQRDARAIKVNNYIYTHADHTRLPRMTEPACLQMSNTPS